ncbi:hypothetical protein HDV05_008665, partial [Chytridiales sp. JEL 0842]
MHSDLRPENVLLNSEMKPIICGFGPSKAFDKESKSVRFASDLAYFAPEQHTGKVGREGDIFSLGLTFVELGLFLAGKESLKYHFRSGIFADIKRDFDGFMETNFPIAGTPGRVMWTSSFRQLITSMLHDSPQQRPKASEVWEHVKEMVKSFSGKPHCEEVSSVESAPSEHEEDDEEGEDEE